MCVYYDFLFVTELSGIKFNILNNSLKSVLFSLLPEQYLSVQGIVE